MMPEKSTAPWSLDEVASLNEYQNDPHTHSYSCRQPEHGSYRPTLFATTDGWVCGYRGCDFTQDWAELRMTNWSWQASARVNGKQYNDCLRKRQWPNEVRANAVIHDMVMTGRVRPGVLHAYLCVWCQRWHTGRNRLAEERWDD